MNIFQSKKEQPWLHYTFEDLLPDNLYKQLTTFPSEQFNLDEGNIESKEVVNTDTGYSKRNESKDTYGDTIVHNIKDKNIIDLFTNVKLIQSIKDELDIDLKGKVVKAELFEMKKLFNPEIHLDRPSKLITVLVYLKSDVVKETGTWLYNKDKTLHSKLDFKTNSGITFVNAPETWHRVPVMERGAEYTRRSLLVTYRELPKLNYRDMLKYKNEIFIV